MGQRCRHRWAVTLSMHRHGAMNRWLPVLCLWIYIFSCHVLADVAVDARSQRHSKKPLIGQRYINDQDGNLVLPKGEQYNDDYIYNEMDWFVEGVVGEAPGEPPQPVE